MNKDESPCLHCSLMEMISAYWYHFANKDAESGSPIMDASQTLLSLAEAQASIIGRLAAGAEQQAAVEDVKTRPSATPPETERMPLIMLVYRVFQGGHLSRET